MEREYIGIDLHKAFSQVCAINATAERQWEQRWPTTDAGMTGLLARCGRHSRVAVEASGPTWAFVDRMVEHVADALRRDSVVGIYYPPPAIRDLRELGRYRCHLARLQASCKQRIHALLLRQGIATPPALFNPARAAVARDADAVGVGRQRAARPAAGLGERPSPIGPGDDRDSRRGRQRPDRPPLDARPGFGPVFSLTLRAETATIARFPDGPHLASYAGLVPRIERSGSRHWSGRLPKTGSSWMRWTLLEAAIHQFRRQDACWARAA